MKGLTVCVPVYNGAADVKECLAAVVDALEPLVLSTHTLSFQTTRPVTTRRPFAKSTSRHTVVLACRGMSTSNRHGWAG